MKEMQVLTKGLAQDSAGDSAKAAGDLQSKDIVLNSEVRDSGGKVIFGNNELCSQFLRDYVDLPQLKYVTSEDIEDVSDQFVPLFAEERNADRVKRVHLKPNKAADVSGVGADNRTGEEIEEEPPFFLISLIEHKTKVEYNVCMQIFRYMVYIWDAYEKEMEKKHDGISKTKGFRYPPILPIVYYEGREEWVAPVDFKGRVNKSDVFGEYIPDFKYYLVPIQKYSNADLLSKEDEISLIMLINKMQRWEDAEAFNDVPDDKLDKILKDTPKDIRNIIADILLAFQLKAQVPLDLAEANARKVREKDVARLFENADFGEDFFGTSKLFKVQREQWLAQKEQEKQLAEQGEQLAEQKEQLAEQEEQLAEQEEQLAEQEEQLAEQEKQLAEQEEQLAEQEKHIAEQKEQLAEQKEQLAEKDEQLALQKKATEKAEQDRENSIKAFIEIMQEAGMTLEMAYTKLLQKHHLTEGEAKQKLQKYWK